MVGVASPRAGYSGEITSEPPLRPDCGQPESAALAGPEHGWECRNEACPEFGQPLRPDEPPPPERPNPGR